MLSARQVSFRYPQGGHGVPPTSLEVVPGDLTLITGPSGCGKSTLARCLMGLIPHLYYGELSGEVWSNGYRTSETQLWQLADKAGMVFQNPAAQMLTLTVEDEIVFGLENLGLKRNEIKARLETALAEFDLAHMRARNPQTLSGGEQQKLALAAILARQPEVLILDEPLSMLDTTAVGSLIAYLERFAAAGKAVAIFEHRREYLEGAAGLRLLALEGKSNAEDLQPNEMTLPFHPSFKLEIEGLCIQFGGRAIFQGLDLSLDSRQIVAVVGRNGVGKTTLLRALAGLQKYSGVVNVVTGSGDQRPNLGMIFQNSDLQLFNASVREVFIVNGLVRDNIPRALNGENVGTRNYKA